MPGEQTTNTTTGPDEEAAVTLSVIVPTHEVAPWIRETIECILRQDVAGMEVIVVDDHSTDRSPEIVAEFAARDPRVTLVHATEHGGATARNTGLDRARGRYVVFADGDDIIPDGAYAALVGSLETSGSDVAIGDYLKFRPMDTWRPTDSMAAFGQPRTGVTLREVPSLVFSRPCWNKVFRRDWWEAEHIRFPEVPRSNDIVPMTRAYVRARRIDLIDDVVYLYRERPGGSSMTSRADSSASMLSYLTQERECARMIGDLHDPDMDRAYASLVYDRDGFMHISKYISTWEEPREADAAVAAAIQALLAETARAAPHMHPLKRLTVQLAGHGEMAAARTMSEAATLDAAENGVSIEQWRHAIERVAALGLLRPSDDRAFEGPLSAALCGPVTPDEAPAWRALIGAVRRQFGDRALMLVPEGRIRPDADARALADRARVGGLVTEIAGGDRVVVVEGRSALGATEVAPVLYDGEFAGNPPVRTEDVTWVRDSEGWQWTARFGVKTVPLHRPLTPAMEVRATGVCAAIPGEGELPDYTARDSFLYHRVGGVTVIRRRRHWAPRALRRALIVARDRALRPLHRR